MIFSKIGYPPQHKYIWVDTRFTHEKPIGFVEAEWVGLTSIPNEVWGINVIFRDGGMPYRKIPPHAIKFNNTNENDTNWEITDAQMWDCYSDHFTLLLNPHLCGRVSALVRGRIMRGNYLFSATHIGDGYSSSPEQDKEFYFIQLDNDRLTILPTNRVCFIDNSFIVPNPSLPKLKLSTTTYSCERNTPNQ
jgi:hypothetical protein